MLEVSAAIRDGRRYAVTLMADTFTAYAPGADGTDADGYHTEGYADQGSTLGKVQSRSRQGDTQTRTVRIGGSDRPVVEGGIQIPLDAPAPVAGPYGTGWEYECTAVGPDSDPTLLGRRWLVVDAPAKSYATARRLDVVEL